MDSEQQSHDLKMRVWEEEAKLERPLYRLFVRDQITVQTDGDTLVLTNPKKLRKEPLVWLFFVVNSVWGCCCLCLIPSGFGEGQMTAMVKFVAWWWLASLPAIFVYVREVSKAEEPLDDGGFLVFALRNFWAPFLGFFGGLFVMLCLGALGFKSLLGWKL
jgi:hypothetical protein